MVHTYNAIMYVVDWLPGIWSLSIAFLFQGSCSTLFIQALTNILCFILFTSVDLDLNKRSITDVKRLPWSEYEPHTLTIQYLVGIVQFFPEIDRSFLPRL